MNSIIRSFLWRSWLPVTAIIVWQIALRDSRNPFFPSPLKILNDAKYVITPEWINVSVRSSLTALFLGYSIGAILGIVSGSVIGSNDSVREVLAPITNFLRSIPSVAKVPVIIAILGIGTASRICAISVGVLFPVLMATMRSVATTDEKLLDLAALMGYSPLRSLVFIRVPAATGDILTGLHAAVQVAMMVMVVSEMLGSGVGIGAFVVQSQNSFMIADMWVGILVLGVIGVTLNAFFTFAEKKMAPWYFGAKALR
jgi:sulfonate transport system permease protein